MESKTTAIRAIKQEWSAQIEAQQAKSASAVFGVRTCNRTGNLTEMHPGYSHGKERLADLSENTTVIISSTVTNQTSTYPISCVDRADPLFSISTSQAIPRPFLAGISLVLLKMLQRVQQSQQRS